MSTSHLVLLRQDSLGKEHFSKNEVQKITHVVCKNIAFAVDIGFEGYINLHKLRFQAVLLYDSDSGQDFKPVDFVKNSPLTYHVFVSERGDRATIELKISVLSSQHEDSLFRVFLSATDPAVDLPPTQLQIITDPIKVVSKPSLVGKSKRPPKNSDLPVEVSTEATKITKKKISSFFREK